MAMATESQSAPLPAYEDFLRLVSKRRSIRKYQRREVSREVIEKLLEAAYWAPSGKNNQNWRFFVVRGKKKDEYLPLSKKSWEPLRPILEKRLKPKLFKFTEEFFATLGGAPVILFAFSKPNPEENNQTALGGVYMAVNNLMLAAVSLGLGTCPMGASLAIKEELAEFLGIGDEDLQLVCAVVVGYPDHSPPGAQRQVEGRATWLGFDEIGREPRDEDHKPPDQ